MKRRTIESKDKWQLIISDNRDGTKEYYTIAKGNEYEFDAIKDSVIKRNDREGWKRWTIDKPIKVPGKEYKGGVYFFGGFGLSMDVVCYYCALDFLSEAFENADVIDGEIYLEDGRVVRRRNPLEVSGEYKVELKDEVIRLYNETEYAEHLLTEGLICGNCEMVMASPMKCAIIIAQNMAGTDVVKKRKRRR